MASFTEKVKALLALTRFGNSFFGMFSVILSGILSMEFFGNGTEYMTAGVVAIFLFMGSFAINDYFDHLVDMANDRQDRPIVTGAISRNTALQVAVGCMFLAFLISLKLGMFVSLFIGFNILLSIFYSSYLKRVLLLKNISIAYCFTATIIFGTIIVDAIAEPLVQFYMLMAFLVGLAFEIMADISDMEGDMQHRVQTLAWRISPRSAAIISSVIFSVVCILDPLPYFVDLHPNLVHDTLFLLLIVPIAVVYLLISRSLIHDQSKENVLKLRSRTIVLMQIGSLVYLVGFLV
ncbi:UbiA family prenyltransferase [Methanococcoides methylutens]|uniref:UbiA family prenyltransferase n=1 Tax=Methanococcoides methylutens TaxID=2226 RepID=UPI004044853F